MQIFLIFVITGHNCNPWTDKNGTPQAPLNPCLLTSLHSHACLKCLNKRQHVMFGSL